MNTLKLYFLIYSILFFSPSSFAAFCTPGDTEQAKNFFKQAKQADSYEKRLSYLEKAAANCQSFQISYYRGDALLRLSQPEQALVALKMAENQASNSPKIKAKLYTLLASAYLAKQQFTEARYKSEMAYNLYRLELAKTPPPQLMKIMAQLDDKDLNRVVSAAEMTGVLEGKKGAGALPSISVFIQFDTGQATLSALGSQQIVQLSKALAAYLAGFNVLVIGHTDSRGSADYNLKLSEQRAKTVADYLKKQYPKQHQYFKTRGKGEQQLRYPGDSEQDHLRNRRVEVNLLLRNN